MRSHRVKEVVSAEQPRAALHPLAPCVRMRICEGPLFARGLS